MPQSNETLLQERKRLKRAVKRIKKTATARKRTRAALAPKKAKAKRDWLTKPVKRYKLVGGKRTYAIPAQKKPLVALPTSAPGKSTMSAHVSGQVPGTALTWIPVISSNVAAYAYDAKTEELHIAFLDQSHYLYESVPEDVWLRFQGSVSKGRFVWTDIRDRFAYTRVE